MRSKGSGAVWRGGENLILASRSLARRSLLHGCGIEAEPVMADIDERAIEARETRRGALPCTVARHLAAEKALVVSRRSPGRFVLGADQVLAFEDRCCAKAATLAEAASRLAELAGKSHRLVSACAIARDGALLFEAAETAELHMRDLSPAGDSSLSRIRRRGGAGKRRRLSGGEPGSASLRAHRWRPCGHFRACLCRAFSPICVRPASSDSRLGRADRLPSARALLQLVGGAWPYRKPVPSLGMML